MNISQHPEATRTSVCSFCKAPLTRTFVDLGMHPLCESYVSPAHLNQMEPFYPLHAFICERCLLVQLQEYVSPADIFTEYAYFSSYSESWVQHARNYVAMISARLNLTQASFVVEIASNDGYLLRHFVEKKVPVLGIEPAANIAKVAAQQGIPTLVRFFGTETAREVAAKHRRADLIAGNNVLAHVPQLNDFVAGVKTLLADEGVATFEFPHLLRLMVENQFDTIYHEHFSYFSVLVVEKVFTAHGMTVFDVEELPTHGGSLRIYACHADSGRAEPSERLRHVEATELAAGLDRLECYGDFGEQVKETKRNILNFLIEAKRKGKTIAGYGAPGKGNTLLNYCGIRSDFLDYTVDRNTYKHGLFLPGTHIPIFPPSRIQETKPDYVFVLPWNLKDEIMAQLSDIRTWGGQFVIPIPHIQVL